MPELTPENAEATAEDVSKDDAKEPANSGSVNSALGSPHDGYAAVALTLGITAALFVSGQSRIVDDFSFATVMAVILALGTFLAAFWYYLKAHGGDHRAGPIMPRVATTLAALIMYAVVAGPFAAAWSSRWEHGLACLCLATLIIGPLQIVLSKEPGRDKHTS